MDSFGEYLKRERKLRGVTLEEIAKSSNISKVYLVALEEDDLESLPSEVFVKGFLKCYAENTGMNYNEVILAYNSFVASRKTAQTSSQRPLEKQPTFNMKWSSFLAIAIFVVVSSFMVFYYVKKSGEIKPSPVSEGKIYQEADDVGVEENKGNIGVLPDSDIAEDIQPGKEDIIPSENINAELQGQKLLDDLTALLETEKISEVEKIPETLTLSMEATESAWISMIIDDGENKEALLMPGETAKWEAKEKFMVSLGNAAGTSLKLNGKKITLPKAPRNVVKDFTITLENIN